MNPANSLVKYQQRANRQSVKFAFRMIIHSVDIHAPIDAKRTLTVQWTRGPHKMKTQGAHNTSGSKTYSHFEWGPNQALKMSATLYQDKQRKFQSKSSKLTILSNHRGKVVTIGRVTLDLSKYVNEDGKFFSDRITRSVEKSAKKADISLSIYSRYQKTDDTNMGDSNTDLPSRSNINSISGNPENSITVGLDNDDDFYEQQPQYVSPIHKYDQINSPNYLILKEVLEKSFTGSRKHLLYEYKFAFTGSLLADRLHNERYIQNIEDAQEYGNGLLRENIIRFTDQKLAGSDFKNDNSTTYMLNNIPGKDEENLPLLNLTEVMDTPEYVTVMKEFLKKNNALTPFLFLEKIHQYKSCGKNAEQPDLHRVTSDEFRVARDQAIQNDPRKSFDRLSTDDFRHVRAAPTMKRSDLANEIIETYVNQDGSNKISFAPRIVQEMKSLVKERKFRDNLFDHGEKAVTKSLLKLFAKFHDAEEYEKMIGQNTLENDSQLFSPTSRLSVDKNKKHRLSIIAEDQVNVINENIESKELSSSPIPNNIVLKRRGTQWYTDLSYDFSYLGFEQAIAQVESGIKTIKQLCSYVDKVRKKSEAYANGLRKSKIPEHPDGMRGVKEMERTLQSAISVVANVHSEFSSNLQESVINELRRFVDTSEDEVRKIKVNYVRASSDLNQRKFDTKKKKDFALRAISQLKSERRKEKEREKREREKREHNRMETKTKLTLTLGSVLASKGSEYYHKRLSTAATEYKMAVGETNEFQKKYYEQDLPKFLQLLEQREKERLTIMCKIINQFAMHQQNQLKKIAEEISKVSKVSNSVDIKRNLEQFQASCGKEPPRQIFKELNYTLPVTLEEIRNGDIYEEDGVPSKPANVVFNVPLETIMSEENINHQDTELKLPCIIPTLMHHIVQQGGRKTEGVFRISAGAAQLEKLEKDYELGHYGVSVSDPHLPAALLKQWLRSLPEPLIPLNAYQNCIDFAKQHATTKNMKTTELLTGMNKILDTFPPINVRILIQLSLLSEHISANKEINKMDLKNIACVFAPTLMRNPVVDQVAMFANTAIEQSFVRIMLAVLAAQHKDTPMPFLKNRVSSPIIKGRRDTLYQNIIDANLESGVCRSREVMLSDDDETEEENVTKSKKLRRNSTRILTNSTINNCDDDSSSDADG